MVGFYSHEAMKCCYITVDGILCIQLVIGFIACRMLSHFMYFVRNDEIKMFNQSLILRSYYITGFVCLKIGIKSIRHNAVCPAFM